MDIQTTIGGITFTNCLMNASGVLCTDEEELNQLIAAPNGAYVTKSATLQPREGNPKPRYYDLPMGSINAMGLPNLGIDFYLNFVLQNSSYKTPFVSIAGLSLEENIELLNKIKDVDFQGFVELNLSCPNIAGKPQTAYDFDRTQEVLDQVFKIYQKPLGVKLPPYFDEVHFHQMAAILNQYPLTFVTCINSIGNGLCINLEEERAVIKPKEGFGGIGGAYIKPTALANVRKFYNLLNKDIAIIGCGGVNNGNDVFEHILCGASMVQIGTQLMKEGVDVFTRLHNELNAIMIYKGYESIEDFKGKLKPL